MAQDKFMQSITGGVKEVKGVVTDLWRTFRPYAKYVLLALLVYIVINPSKISELSRKVYDFFENLVRGFMAWLNKIAARISQRLMPQEEKEEATTQKDLFEVDPSII